MTIRFKNDKFVRPRAADDKRRANCAATGNCLFYNIPNNMDTAQNGTAANVNMAKETAPPTATGIGGLLCDVLDTPPRTVVSSPDGAAPKAIDIAAPLPRLPA